MRGKNEEEEVLLLVQVVIRITVLWERSKQRRISRFSLSSVENVYTTVIIYKHGN